MLGTLDLEHIRTFVRVVRTGSLTKAAAALGVPKSTVSRRLADLERELATQLVQRTTRRVAITEAGYLLFERAESHILGLEAATRTITDGSGELRGTLRVTAPAGLTSISLVPVVQSFLMLHPQVKLVVSATNRRVDLVAEGVDLALRAGPLVPSSLIARKLTSSEFRLFASPEYLARRGVPYRVSDLTEHECLMFSEEQPYQKWQLRSVNPPYKRFDLRVTGRFAITDFGALARACADGLGIALLPSIGDVPALSVQRVLPDWRGPDAILYAVYPSANHVSPILRAFVDHVATHSALLQAPNSVPANA